ncbi:LAMI_0A06634g1_1 [Lachancea mirantina]|uniref:LAMI_0A06634g1_1 n=1 Tax=Lachancea mirantina TaxID=1230905 RepID=A0A1G4IQA7_9SACH|nr:LAMI_0A06634g1_1 [Lachancea mirantina]
MPSPMHRMVVEEPCGTGFSESLGDSSGDAHTESLHLGKIRVLEAAEPLRTSESHESTLVALLESNWKLLAVCFGVASAGFFFGYDTGTIGGITAMQPWLAHFGQSDSTNQSYFMPTVRVGTIVSAFHVGCVSGGFSIARLSDSFGRRMPIAFACITYALGVSIQVCSVQGAWIQYLVGRIVVGLAVGSNAVVVPMLLSEIAPPGLRGVVVAFYGICVTHGILLGYITDYVAKSVYADDRAWRIPLAVGYSFSLILGFALARVPESPRFLIQKGRNQEALASITSFKKMTANAMADDPVRCDAIEEFEYLRTVYEYQQHETAGVAFWHLFNRRYLKRTVSGMCVMAFQQLAGIDYFLYYGTSLFQSVGMHDSYVTSILLGTINAVTRYISIFVADNWGRRPGLILGSLGCFVCLAVFSTAGVFAVDHHSAYLDGHTAGIVMVIFTCLYIAVFSCSWAAVAPVLVSEIFTLSIKSRAMALSQSLNWATNFFIALCTPIATASMGYGFGYVFAAAMLISLCCVLILIPETKGMTLEQIDTFYDKINGF